YFRACVAWNRLSNGRFYPRFVDASTAFDDGSPFATTAPGTPVEVLLGYLSSTPVRYLLGLFNQGRKTEVGHLSMLPWPMHGMDEEKVRSGVARMVDLARSDWNRSETAPEFAELWGRGV